MHEEAVASMRRALAIIEPLAAADVRNARLQVDVAVAQDQFGDTLRAADRPGPALDAYRAGIAIRERLVGIDGANVPWRQSLATSYDKAAALLVAAKNPEGALELLRKMLAVREGLARAADVQSQRDVADAHRKIGDALNALGRSQEAIAAFRSRLAVVEKYAAAHPESTDYQFDLLDALGYLAVAGDDPRGRLERALAIARKLDAEGRLPANQKGLIAFIQKAIAELPK
jgi:tetratricopeptide (TPR) repeat protein